MRSVRNAGIEFEVKLMGQQKADLKASSKEALSEHWKENQRNPKAKAKLKATHVNCRLRTASWVLLVLLLLVLLLLLHRRLRLADRRSRRGHRVLLHTEVSRLRLRLRLLRRMKLSARG